MKKRIIWGLILSAVVGILLLWLHQTRSHLAAPDAPQAGSTPLVAPSANQNLPTAGQPIGHELPQHAQPPAEKTNAIRAIFNSPLSLYGKVVDQSGLPIPEAVVKIRVANEPLGSGSPAQRTTDQDGLFEVTDVNGACIYAEAEKEGYYSGKESRRLLQSGEMPNKDSPLLLRLFKKGEGQDLIRHSNVSAVVPLDGTPIEYDFNEKNFVSEGRGQLKVRVWVEGTMQQHFSWRYQISVPAGGFVSRGNEFDFTSPSEGFTETLKGSVDAADKNWRGSFNGDYFVRLPDGKFGRIKFSLGRGRDSFGFRIENLVVNGSGERNLE